MSGGGKTLIERLGGVKVIALVALAGLALILWPSGGGSGAEPTEEQRLMAVLSQIEGVGPTQVLLSEQGAVVVCRGADAPAVRLAVTGAVRCYTGLGADRVLILKLDADE